MDTPALDYGRAPNPCSEIPRYVAYTSPVSTGRMNEGSPAATLPLNLVARIVGYLDDIGDIARVTRTSRLLYYMSLPQLYQRVNLHSYGDIRYVNGRPEGFGSGSPLIMALDGLVTKSHAALVEEFKIWGSWKELGVEDFAKGRVPDNSMMLNILLRAATDKMMKLRSFSWELDSKPLKTLYQGLSAHTTLTSLSIKCPTSKVPRPSVMVPAMPNLRVFKVTDIDPLCYPDDISMLLLHSRRLEDLRLHFSPRMRREAEPSVSLHTYFGRCWNAGYRLRVKHFALQSFFGVSMEGAEAIWDPDTCKSTTFIDTFGGTGANPRNVYVDDTWKNIPTDMKTDCRIVRINEVAPQHVELMRRAIGQECLYIINAKRPKTEDTDDSPTSTLITPGDTPPADEEMAQLGKEYLYVLTRHHGQTLKHLLLHDQWAFGPEDVGDLVRYCPNLEQLGLALNSSNHATMRLLMPFLPKLKAVRILHNEWLAEHMRVISHEDRLAGMSADLWKAGAQQLEWIGIADAVYKCGKNYQAAKADGTTEWRREVTMASRADVQHVEIWSLDVLDISADPIAPFSP
ncbi:hypothetical protein LTR85_008756 [Meristemomyces frigidus]|nr:hypothetical protein LTR85_008756 [Meristemomyces frigidus]